jgi:hypothetical protein
MKMTSKVGKAAFSPVSITISVDTPEEAAALVKARRAIKKASLARDLGSTAEANDTRIVNGVLMLVGSALDTKNHHATRDFDVNAPR